jgi:hypothetical protein
VSHDVANPPAGLAGGGCHVAAAGGRAATSRSVHRCTLSKKRRNGRSTR